MLSLQIIQMALFGVLLFFGWDTFPSQAGIAVLTFHTFIMLLTTSIIAFLAIRVASSRGGFDDIARFVTGNLITSFLFAVGVSLLNGTWFPFEIPFIDPNLVILPVDTIVALFVFTVSGLLTYFMLRTHRPRSA